MAGHREIIADDREGRWREALHQAGDFDTYHLASFHRLAAERGKYRSFLLVFREAGRIAAIPFLVKPVSEIDGLEGSPLLDALSVYGYPGAVSNVAAEDAGADRFRRLFQEALLETLGDLGAVSFCSRLNPLIPTSWLLEGAGEITEIGRTVAINLKKPVREQWGEIRKGHRLDIRRRRREGFSVVEDGTRESLSLFAEIYRENMARVGAGTDYFFPPEYFSGLRSALGKCFKLFWAIKDGKPVSGAVFFATNRIIQYHLSATPDRFARLGAAKLILDEVRIRGSAKRFEWLHLGGGLGSKSDSLFWFKSGFSPLRFPFRIFHLILEPKAYDQLCRLREDRVKKMGERRRAEAFFPRYRAPYI